MTEEKPLKVYYVFPIKFREQRSYTSDVEVISLPDLETKKKKLIDEIDKLDGGQNILITEFKNKAKQKIEDILIWK